MAHRKSIGNVILQDGTPSANVSSPLRRRTLAAQVQVDLPKSPTQNDDENEIIARRRPPVPVETPKTLDNSERRVSLGLVGALSINEITEHYNKCIKLCAENKITTKNVFALSVIDYIGVVTKRDQNSNNMQTAGTTMDVSAKIYGLRVDCIHGDIFKMAGTSENQNKHDVTENSAGNSANTSLVENREVGEKKKRRAKKILGTIESLAGKPETLNLSSTNDNSDQQTTDTLLQVTFPIHVFNGQSLHLYEDVLLDFAPQKTKENKQTCEDVIVPAVENFDDLHICKMFQDFHMIGWSEADIPESPDMDTTQNNEDFRFDMDASVPTPCQDSNLGMNYFDLDEASQENIDRCARRGEPAEHIVDFSGLVRAPEEEKTLEYSYVQKNVTLHWAGPTHWKPKLFPRTQSKGEKTVEIPRQKAGRKAVELILEFNANYIEAMLKNMTRKIKQHLQMKTVMRAWNEDKVTLPEDLHYDDTAPTKYYHWSFKDKSILWLSKPNGKRDQMDPGTDRDGDAAVVEDGVNYDYSNQNDTLDYCPHDNDAEGYNEDERAEEQNQNPDDVFATQGFIGDNLVAAPKSTTQIHIQYSTRAKQIDMKQLKRSIWKSLTDKNSIVKEVDENLGQRESDMANSKMKEVRCFSDIYKKLPNILAKTNVDALTPALAFASLLHLANEKTLCLVPTPDISDLKIMQG
ncbi:condensin complex subunit 2 [Athalia rosae]|uniref:condensin complex subunit 2 n=1 Tax=Athalia rosae TaxID=37344 RepID=UPI0020344897|nr:condensin complex subunit 2 [Athalia rosae]XP_048505901.1 condensin complex subunit 2 [Athalia rosae]